MEKKNNLISDNFKSNAICAVNFNPMKKFKKENMLILLISILVKNAISFNNNNLTE